jgi:hypothetical protein
MIYRENEGCWILGPGGTRGKVMHVNHFQQMIAFACYFSGMSGCSLKLGKWAWIVIVATFVLVLLLLGSGIFTFTRGSLVLDCGSCELNRLHNIN